MGKTEELKERLRKLNNGEFATADTNTGMITRKAQTMEVTIEELAAAVDARRDHPAAQAYRRTIQAYTHPKDGLLRKEKVVVDREDMEALLDNKEVVRVSQGIQVEEGFASEVVSKKVGDILKPAAPSAPESSTPAKPGK